MPLEEERKLNAGPDFPDNRDWVYRPSLITLADRIDPPRNALILDQGSEGACTGYALAAAINQLRRNTMAGTYEVSETMLYEMAKRHDEWAGEDYEGSSLRGAIHGWKNMGVCLRSSWPADSDTPDLTLERAREARKVTPGAYYRLRPVISDYHAALNEVGVIVCSARVHSGWDIQGTNQDEIQAGSDIKGAHAFAIVGYSQDANQKGFWVQNSWGEDWGDSGIALWPYDDWIRNVMDAWVFRPALENSEIFAIRPSYSKLLALDSVHTSSKKSPTRDEIAGHFIHVNNGDYAKIDRYWSDKNDIQQTIDAIDTSDTSYKHLLFFAHGGLVTPEASARRIASMKPVFKDNGIYPVHIMYDTGLAQELKDVLSRKGGDAEVRTAGVGNFFDRVVEKLARVPCTLLWEEIKRDARAALFWQGAGAVLEAFELFDTKFAPLDVKYHFVGHSTGAVLFGYFLQAINEVYKQDVEIETASLLGAACNKDMFEDHYLPVLKGQAFAKISDCRVYNLRDELERDECVVSKAVYRKSLLYLISNALERDLKTNEWSKEKSLLGMEKFKSDYDLELDNFEIVYSNGATSRATRSRTHGGFDNDKYTMNDVLKRVLGGEKIKRKFERQDLLF